MDTNNHKHIAIAYKLYSFSDDQAPALEEEAPASAPFQFISNLGVALDAFEAKVAQLETGANFDFTLSPEEAYGNYEEERVVSLDKKLFEIDGHFDHEHIKVGNIIPLVNEDGLRFQGEVVEVGENKVIIDLNHPLSGLSLHFIGQIVESRPATEKEIEAMIKLMNGDECHCGCHDDNCDCQHDEHDCSHHHHDGDHCCHHHHHDE